MPIFFEDHKPKTLEEALSAILTNLNNYERFYIRDHGTAGIHLTVGMQMRNEWGLWQDSDLAKHFKNRFGLGHADDMSGMIMDGLEYIITNKEWNPETRAEHYREFWRGQGIDPLTQEELSQK